MPLKAMIAISERELDAIERCMTLAVGNEPMRATGQDKAALHRVLNRLQSMRIGNEAADLFIYSKEVKRL